MTDNYRRKPKVWTAEKIFADWRKSLKEGLGKKKLPKTTEDAFNAQFKAQLLVKIKTRLDPPQSRDYNVEGDNTRAVAKTLGKICRMMAPGKNDVVTAAILETAFHLCQLHPRCPGGGGGGGQWCDI